MKLSAWVRQSQLLPETKMVFDRLVLDRFSSKGKHMYAINNPKEVFRDLQKAGVDGAEFLVSSNITEKQLQKVQNIFDDSNVTVLSIHQSLTTLFHISLSEITKLCTIANIFSAKVVVLHLEAIGKNIFDKEFVHALKARERKYKITFAIENSPKNPFNIFTKQFTWKEKEFSSIISDTEFRMTFDITHLAQTGKDIIEFYKKNKNRIINIHLSDYKKRFINTRLFLTTDTHLALGVGELPIKEFLTMLKDDAYEGLITLEIDSNLNELCNSARIIKQNIK